MRQIMRSGYVTKRGVVVKPSMVKNMGRPGKGFPGVVLVSSSRVFWASMGIPKLPLLPKDSVT
jgi:hypothetical protein